MKIKKRLSILWMLAVAFLIFYPSLCWGEIAAGRYHSFQIQPDGTIWAWGLNEYGQLGDGTTTKANVPIKIGSASD